MYDALVAAACLGAFASMFAAVPLGLGFIIRLHSWAAGLTPHADAGQWRRLKQLLAHEGADVEDADDVMMLIEDVRGSGG